MPGPAAISVLAVCSSSSALCAQGRGALKPEVISRPEARSGFKLRSGQWVQILPMDVAGLPQPVACEPHPQSKDRAVSIKGKQSCSFLWQLQLNIGLK